jgi:hypothetical protein
LEEGEKSIEFEGKKTVAYSQSMTSGLANISVVNEVSRLLRKRLFAMTGKLWLQM